MRQEMLFNALPVLEIDGAAFTQSNAICRYIGKMAGLYPLDHLQALYCDETLDAVEDLSHHIGQTFGLEGDALRTAREKLVDGWLTTFLTGLGALLERGGGRYFAGNALTIADLKVLMQTRWLRSGALDHVPADLLDRLAPNLVEHQARIEADPVVTAWYASRS
jgi:glutathione S-transferase